MIDFHDQTIAVEDVRSGEARKRTPRWSARAHSLAAPPDVTTTNVPLTFADTSALEALGI